MLFENQRQAVSPYNVGLTLNLFDQTKVTIFFRELLARFSTDLNLSLAYLEEVEFDFIFTDIEFNKPVPDDNELSFINKYFYPIVFSDIKKNDTHKVDFKTKYVFTLDSSLTKFTSKSGIKYGEIVLGKKPVLYYVHVDIQKIINIIKS